MNRDKDALRQEMGQDGLNIQQLILKQDFYRKCSSCSEPFSSKVVPVLLICGHVLCLQCSKDNYCFTTCSKTQMAKVKIERYTKILNYFSLFQKRNGKTYNFTITNMRSELKSGSGLCLNVPQTKTLQEVLLSSDQFQQFYKIGKDKTSIQIMSRSKIYNKVKNLKISQLQLSDLNLYLRSIEQFGPNAVVVISFFYHNLGGDRNKI